MYECNCCHETKSLYQFHHTMYDQICSDCYSVNEEDGGAYSPEPQIEINPEELPF